MIAEYRRTEELLRQRLLELQGLPHPQRLLAERRIRVLEAELHDVILIKLDLIRHLKEEHFC